MTTDNDGAKTGCVNWGIVGTGDISRSIASDMGLVKGANLRAVASRSQERAVTAAQEFGADRGCSFAELVDAHDIDAIYIGTPHATHRSLAIAALNAGKHVLIEKPVGLNGSEVREIASVAAARGLFAMEAMWMKFNPLYRQLKEEIAAGAIGDVMSVRASFGIPFPKDVGSRWSSELGGSTLLDQCIYPVTLALDILGLPTSIAAIGTMRPDGIDTRQHVTLEFPEGRYAQLAASMVEFVEPTASISGTTGWTTMSFPFWAGRSYSTTRGSKLFEPSVVKANFAGYGYSAMLEAVNEAIKSGDLEHSLHKWSEVFAVFEVLDEIRSQMNGVGPADIVRARK
jgi:predicted dehydrogenase